MVIWIEWRWWLRREMIIAGELDRWTHHYWCLVSFSTRDSHNWSADEVEWNWETGECSVMTGSSAMRWRNRMRCTRGNRSCFWWMIREQQHRMMRREEKDYLKIEGNRSSGSTNHRTEFHWMITDGYLCQSIHKSSLSRITEPINQKLSPSPLNEVSEGRSN